MKKLWLFTLMTAGILFFNAQAHAVAALDLSGNDYNVYMICSDDLGDYCDQGKIKIDTFIFDAGGAFSIKSLESAYWGFAGDGEYNSLSSRTFDATYSAMKDLDTYDFAIKGINLSDTILFGFNLSDAIIFGIMDITYTENDIIHQNETEGKAFFLGLKK